MTSRTRTLWTFAITSAALFMVVLDNLVVTTALPVPRFAGRDFAEHRWLLVDAASPRGLVERLRGAGIEQFVFLTRNVDAEPTVVEGARLVRSHESGGWQYLVYAT